MKIKTVIKKFENLLPSELYDFLQLRQDVFIIEQNCIYQDIDGVDRVSDHVMVYENGKLQSYTRITPPGTRYENDYTIGRVASNPKTRKGGFGKIAMSESIQFIEKTYHTSKIRISAQAYLQKFYENYGFKVVSESYLEDNIPHYEMLRN